jgi:hypothetical protein
LLYCIVAFADVSRQKAYDFAVRCAEILRSDEGSKTLETFISDAGAGTSGRIGWSESFWFSNCKLNTDNDLKQLNIDRVLIREPDLDNPTQIKLTVNKSAQCLIPPEKIAVVYFSDPQKDVRAVLVLPLVSSRGKTMLCPMLVEPVADKPANLDVGAIEEIPIQKNLSTIPGVEIIKLADDDNSYGFPVPEQDETKRRVFETNPLGCTMRQTVLRVLDQGTWVKGFSCLPSGRFRIHCELLAGESETVENKLLNAVAGAFNLNIKIADGYLWNGFEVTPPNPLPACFKITRDAEGQSAMHGAGDYEGYSLYELLSNALHKKPIEIHSTNTAERYDVRLEVWPEAYGEMTALEQLGFIINQTKLQKRTLLISFHKR